LITKPYTLISWGTETPEKICLDKVYMGLGSLKCEQPSLNRDLALH